MTPWEPGDFPLCLRETTWPVTVDVLRKLPSAFHAHGSASAVVCPTVSYVSCLLPNSPVKPEEMDWSELYPEFFAPLTQNKSHDDPKDKRDEQSGAQVEFADIGCGYGGLLGNVLVLSRGQGQAWVLPSQQVRGRVN